MRLIDALELKRSIAASAVVEDGKHIFDIIDEQPTIEPKQGEWISGDTPPDESGLYIVTEKWYGGAGSDHEIL